MRGWILDQGLDDFATGDFVEGFDDVVEGEAVGDEIGGGEFAFADPLAELGLAFLFVAAGGPLVDEEVKIEVGLGFVDVKDGVGKHAVDAVGAAPAEQGKALLEDVGMADGINHGVELLGTFDLVAGGKGGIGPEGEGLGLLVGVAVHDADPAEAEEAAEFDKTEADGACAVDEHVISWLEVEVAKGPEDLAPGAEEDGLFGGDVGIHFGLDLIDFEPAVGLIGHAIGDHSLVVIGQGVFAKAAPAGVHAFHLQVKGQAAHGAVAHGKVADFFADGDDDADALMTEGEGELVLHAGEVAMEEFAVGAVAQAGALGFDEGLVRARLGRGSIEDFDLAGMQGDDGFHEFSGLLRGLAKAAERWE